MTLYHPNSGFYDVPEKDDDALRAAVALNPISIAIQAN